MKQYSFLNEDLFYKYNDEKSVLYHLSYENLDGKTLIPRVPRTLYHKDEDHTTKRVCFSTSISRALHGAPPYRSNVYYVHKAVNVDPESVYKPSKKQVFNIEGTNEVWILKPVKLKYLGLIFKTPGKIKELTRTINTVFEKFKDFKYEWEWISDKYEPPYCINQIIQKYPREVIIRMLGSFDDKIWNIQDKDSPGVKTHKWRAKTGIELVHPEPSLEEQNRVWKNWNYMTPKMRKISDKQCKEFYGCTNAENYKKIMTNLWNRELMDFPKEEIPTLKNQDRIITTRVSDDYNKYHVGDIVRTPWNKVYKIVDRKDFTDIKDHPYYKELTIQQRSKISRYDGYCVLTLEKI